MALHHRDQVVRRPGKIESFFKCESLEQRRLLTTLHGGEVFEFFDPYDPGTDAEDRRVIRVALNGNISVELVGSIVDAGNNIFLRDIPGRLTASPIGRVGAVFGGLGGGTGAQVIGPTTIDDPINGAAGTFPVTPQDEILLQALASNDLGETYAFNIVPDDTATPPTTYVQVVQIDPLTGAGTVVHSIEADLPQSGPPDPRSTVESILAADFDSTGLLWFVVLADVGNQTLPVLYSIDVNTGVVTPTAGAFGANATDVPEVVGIAFDDNDELHALLQVDGETHLVVVDITNTDVQTNDVEVELDGDPLDGLVGIEFLPGDLDNVCAISNDSVYRIDRNTGGAFLLGTVSLDPDPDTDVAETLAGFTYIATLTDPFTGELGALIATDTETDQLVFINKAEREGHHLFNLHITRSDANSYITIGMVVDRDPDGRPPTMQPFDGDINVVGGGFRVTNIQGNPALIVVNANGGTGRVLLGHRSVDLAATDNVDESLFPFLEADIGSRIGTRPVGPGTVDAGILVTNTLLRYRDGVESLANSMVGNNLDDILGMSVRNNGQLWVIDGDHVDATGAQIDGDELAYLGLTPATVSVIDSNTGDALEEVLAMDWGDPDGDGTERLYAVYDVAGVITLGIINTNINGPAFGEFSAIGALGAGDLGIQAMTFVGSRLIAVDNAGDVVEFDATDGTSVGLLRTSTLVVGSMDADDDGNVFMHDTQWGRLLDFDLSNNEVGLATRTSFSSLPPSVGAIAFDPESDAWLAIDNGTSSLALGSFREGLSDESAALMQLTGTTNGDALPQDIGKILFGGTVTGKVDVSGSMGTFYAGWLLTGDAGGQLFGSPTVPGNFSVGGELRDLIVRDSIGTHETPGNNQFADIQYLTGFDLRVGGRLGQVRTYENFTGSVDVVGATTDVLDGILQEEIETRAGTRGEIVIDPNFGPILTILTASFETGYIPTRSDADDDDGQVWSDVNNDTFATAQFLGAINTGTIGNDSVQVRGGLVASDTNPQLFDYVDYYGVGLMAGQTITVQLLDLFSVALAGTGLTSLGLLALGVYDPDGRLILTDYSNVDPLHVLGNVLRFTADRPGIYRFAVAVYGDADFNGAAGEFDTANAGVVPYELRIRRVGNVALGALAATGDIFDGSIGLILPTTSSTPIRVRNGDLGAVWAGDSFGSLAIPFVNLLSPEPSLVLDGTTIEVRTGDLRAIEANEIGRITGAADNRTIELGVDLEVNRGSVGSVRAATNVVLNDDLWLYGVPAVSDQDPIGLARETAVGGDYQVIHAGGTLFGSAMANGAIGVIRAGDMQTRTPSFFVADADNAGRDGIIDLIDVAGDLGTLAGGGPALVTGPGGNVRYIRAGGLMFRDEYFGGGAPETTTYDPGESARLNDDTGTRLTISPTDDFTSLTATTYGVRGSGGSAIVSITSNGGLTIRSNATATTAAAEIGSINANGFLSLGGTARIDVLQIIGGGNFAEIINNTTGEIVGGTVGDVGVFTAETIGVPKQSTGAAVLGQAVFANAYPFNQARTMLNVGSVQLMQARGAIGNVNAAFIQQLIADSNKKRAKGTFDGIAGPVFSTGGIADVEIGMGILPSGSGQGSLAGLYADGDIVQVRGRNANIYGNIVTESNIDRIHLVGDSSIVNANIMSVTDLAMSREFEDEIEAPDDGDSVNNPEYDIGSVFIDAPTPRGSNVPAAGGIIGSLFLAGDIGTTRVRNGFGLINSVYSVLGDGRMADFLIDGYGIRDVQIIAGAAIGRMIATGRGNHLAATRWSKAVRNSESKAWHPYINMANSRLNDIHKYLQTTAADPIITAGKITSSGVIAGTSVKASRDIDLIQAFQIRPSDRLTPPGLLLPLPIESRFDVANKIESIVTISDIVNSEITTGQVDRFQIGRNVVSIDMTVAGVFSQLRIAGDLTTDSLIEAIGPDGEISEILIGDELDGAIRAERKIGRVRIGDEPNSTGTIMQRNRQIFPPVP